ncbi:MAG: hypothetical protein NVSMB2_03350 [Chloroflexota bacterium]
MSRSARVVQLLLVSFDGPVLKTDRTTFRSRLPRRRLQPTENAMPGCKAVARRLSSIGDVAARVNVRLTRLEVAILVKFFARKTDACALIWTAGDPCVSGSWVNAPATARGMQPGCVPLNKDARVSQSQVAEPLSPLACKRCSA